MGRKIKKEINDPANEMLESAKNRALNALAFAQTSPKKELIENVVFYRFKNLKDAADLPKCIVYQVDMEFLKYSDLPDGIEGWYVPSIYRPVPYDLCELDTGNRIVQGWWTGKRFDGLRLKKSEKVKKWKKTQELNFI